MRLWDVTTTINRHPLPLKSILTQLLVPNHQPVRQSTLFIFLSISSFSAVELQEPPISFSYPLFSELVDRGCTTLLHQGMDVWTFSN